MKLAFLTTSTVVWFLSKDFLQKKETNISLLLFRVTVFGNNYNKSTLFKGTKNSNTFKDEGPNIMYSKE